MGLQLPRDPELRALLFSITTKTCDVLNLADLPQQALALRAALNVSADESCCARILLLTRAVEASCRLRWAALKVLTDLPEAAAIEAVTTCYLAATVATSSPNPDRAWLVQLERRVDACADRARLYTGNKAALGGATLEGRR